MALDALLAGGGRADVRRTQAGFAALALSWSYMFYGVWLNDRAESDVRAALIAEGRTGVSVRAYPTILQPYLRRVVAHDGDEVLGGGKTKPAPVAIRGATRASSRTCSGPTPRRRAASSSRPTRRRTGSASR